MITRRRMQLVGTFVLAVILGVAAEASARPTYFQIFTDRYGLTAADRTYVCGNCHIKWTGTGARNPFGNAVEQQLYIGKSLNQALADLEPMDTDNDGFTNLEEIATYKTLPGYSCADFFLAQGAPIGYDTFITPLVPSCLEPLDIRIEPSSLSFITKGGTSDTLHVQVINNGSTDTITVSSYGFLSGASPLLSVSGPTAPFDLAVGEVAELDVVFSPTVAVIASGTLEIASNDPDEPTVDVAVQGFGFVPTIAPADKRARCLRAIDNEFRRYADRSRREWNRCFLDEVRGLACDAGARDLKIQQAETRFRDFIGGSKDKFCAGQNLNAGLLDLPATCGGTCNLQVGTIATLANCLVCRQNASRDDMLRDGTGTAPPDLPPNAAATAAAVSCQKQLSDRLSKGIGDVQKLLGRCQLANITAASPVDCVATNAAGIGSIQTKVDKAPGRCSDTTGLLGCLFEGGGPNCLGTSAASEGTDLTGAVFGAP